jgi:hypothetical protein
MSFSELLQSSRGPGVIGTILALAVVLGFGCLSMIAFDENIWAGDLSPEAILRQQGRDIESLRHQIQEGEIQMEARLKIKRKVLELDKIESENRSQKSRIIELEGTIKNVELVFKKSLESFEFYKDSYRSYTRGNAKGIKLIELSSKSGTIYRNVTIREVTAVGLQIIHDDGLKRIPFEELPDDLIDFYQFDPKQKAEALEEERLAHSQNEASAAAADEQVLKEKLIKRDQDLRQKKADNACICEAYAGKIRVVENEIKLLQIDLDRAYNEDAVARLAGRSRLSRASVILGKIQAKNDQLKSLKIVLIKMSQDER